MACIWIHIPTLSIGSADSSLFRVNNTVMCIANQVYVCYSDGVLEAKNRNGSWGDLPSRRIFLDMVDRRIWLTGFSLEDADPLERSIIFDRLGMGWSFVPS